MPKSNVAATLDEIQKPINDALKKRGFKRTGRTLNRPMPSGLVHVVNFQMGQFPIGEYLIPGIRESFYGKFAVNLGVVLPCVGRIEHHWEPKRVYQEYDCDVRQRLGALAHEGKDFWWPIQPDVGGVAEDVFRKLHDLGLPFLDRFSSYEEVVREFDREGKLPFSNGGRSALVVAMILHELGDEEEAKRAFQRARTFPTMNPGFAKHVDAIEEACQKEG
jgi:hypothetical protein